MLLSTVGALALAATFFRLMSQARTTVDSEGTKNGACSISEDKEAVPYASISRIHHDLPPGWSMFVHPRGWAYFRNYEYNVVTDDDIRDPLTLRKMTEFCTSARRDHYVGIDDDIEIHVQGTLNLSFCVFVNHAQCIASNEYKEVTDKAALNIRLPPLLRRRRLYWNYLQQHPVHVPTPKRIIEEAVDAINSYRLEYFASTSKTNVPFSQEQCGQLLVMLKGIRDDPDDHSAAATALISWVMKDIYSARMAERYGQLIRGHLTEYRDSLSKPPHSTQPPAFTRSLLSLMMNGPFFGIPQTYLAHAKHASEFRGRLDDLHKTWEAYTQQLTKEYSDFILASTVLLSATMGFLAIPDIQQTAKASGLISVYASLGSITVGIFFIWRHHRQVPSSNTFAYIHNARNNALGLPGHALLLSLPAVLMVWSIIAFAAANVAYTLQGVVAGLTHDASAWAILAFFVVFLVLVAVGLYTFSTIWNWKSNGRF